MGRVETSDIEDMWSSPYIVPQSHRTVFTQEKSYFTVGIVHIAKNTCLCGTCLNTIGAFAFLDSVVAESALFNNTFLPNTVTGLCPVRVIILQRYI